jgi:hypothetical protein
MSGLLTVEQCRNEHEWLPGVATAINKAFVKYKVALKSTTVERRRDVERYPDTVKPLLRHYRPAPKTKGKGLEPMRILNLRAQDLA